MVADTQIENLLIELWEDLRDPNVIWQVGSLLLCLAIASAAGRYFGPGSAPLTGAESTAARLGRGGLRRLTFPLIALGLVLIARALLRQWHHVNLLNFAIPLLISLAAIRMVVFGLRQAFARSGWLAGFERTFASFVWVIVALHIVGVLPELIDWMESIAFSVGKQRLSLWLVLQGIATVLGALLIAFWVSGIVEARLMRAEGLDSNLRVVFSRLAKAVLVLIAVLIGLPLVGIDLTTLSVFGGALGVGLGLGLQKIASNYVSGFIILLDRSIRIGDMIAVDAHRGKVTQITTRFTVVQGLNGIESLVPNEVLVSSVVQNECYSQPQVSVAQSIPVGYGSDVERALTIMVEAARQHARVLKEPTPAAFLSSFGDAGIVLELVYWIADPEKGTLGVKSDINRAVWRGFGEAGIEVPLPPREPRPRSAAPAAVARKQSLPMPQGEFALARNPGETKRLI